MSAVEELKEFALDLLWTWQPRIESLFRTLDPDLWESTRQNPVLLLSRLGEEGVARACERRIELGWVVGASAAFRRHQIPSSVEGTQKFVMVTSPQTATRTAPKTRAGVVWPKAKRRPTANSQTVASLNACRRGVALGGSCGAPLKWRRPRFQIKSKGWRRVDPATAPIGTSARINQADWRARPVMRSGEITTSTAHNRARAIGTGTVRDG